MSRRGFTLTEIMLALSVMGILGIAMTRIMISDSRFVSRQDAMLATRQAARAAMHAATSELRTLGSTNTASYTDPLRAVSPDSIRARLPYAYGVLCTSSGGSYKASLLPTDSIAYNTAVPRGVYRRNADGAFINPGSSTPTVTTIATTTACVSGTDTVKKLTNGKYVQISPTSIFTANPAASFGAVFYLYQDVTYAFGTSTDASLAGRRALFRRVRSSSGVVINDELVAPFDTSAKFRCLVGPSLTVEDCPASGSAGDLSGELRGLELRLITASDKRPQGESDYEKFDLTTRIVFVNRVN